jgi:hypothetical protein
MKEEKLWKRKNYERGKIMKEEKLWKRKNYERGKVMKEENYLNYFKGDSLNISNQNQLIISTLNMK